MKNNNGIKMVWIIVLTYGGLHWITESLDLTHRWNTRIVPLYDRGMISRLTVLWYWTEAHLNLFGACFCLAVALVYGLELIVAKIRTKKDS